MTTAVVPAVPPGPIDQPVQSDPCVAPPEWPVLRFDADDDRLNHVMLWLRCAVTGASVGQALMGVSLAGTTLFGWCACTTP